MAKTIKKKASAEDLYLKESRVWLKQQKARIADCTLHFARYDNELRFYKKMAASLEQLRSLEAEQIELIRLRIRDAQNDLAAYFQNKKRKQ